MDPNEEVTLENIGDIIYRLYDTYRSLDPQVDLTARQRRDYDSTRRLIAGLDLVDGHLLPMRLYTRAQIFLLRWQENPGVQQLNAAYESIFERSRKSATEKRVE